MQEEQKKKSIKLKTATLKHRKTIVVKLKDKEKNKHPPHRQSLENPEKNNT